MRARYLLLVIAAVVGARRGYYSTVLNMTDWYTFEVGARSLIHYHHMAVYGGNPLHLYVDRPIIQIGPPALLLVALGQVLPPLTGNHVFVVVIALMGVAAVAAVEAAAVALAPELRDRVRRAVLLVGPPIVFAWGYTGGEYHHVDDPLAVLGVAVAAWLIARRRPVWLIGLVLGVAVASKPWAIVCAPMLLGVPKPQRARAALFFFGFAAVWWLPFVVAAPGTIHALGTYELTPMPGSVPWLLGLHGDVSHWLRPVQFDLGLLAAAWAARRHGWAAAPVAGIAVRVLFDPYTWSYYVIGPLLVVLLWELAGSRAKLPWRTAATLGALCVLPSLVGSAGAGLSRLSWVAVVLCLTLAGRTERDSEQFLLTGVHIKEPVAA